MHCRLTADTRRMLRREHFEQMKKNAYFINIARGELVDQVALTGALKERRIAGAALDVFEHEPLPTTDPLIALDNVILSPHLSCSTSDIWLATGQAMADGMLRAARGDVPENVVNPEVLGQARFRTKLERFAENKGIEHNGKPR
jgi:phosphoglycerate dehydrogenase-like enzyme